VARLPIELLEAYLELVFLSLVVRLVNDDSPTCRRSAPSRVLFIRVTSLLLDSRYLSWKVLQPWYKSL